MASIRIIDGIKSGLGIEELQRTQQQNNKELKLLVEDAKVNLNEKIAIAVRAYLNDFKGKALPTVFVEVVKFPRYAVSLFDCMVDQRSSIWQTDKFSSKSPIIQEFIDFLQLQAKQIKVVQYKEGLKNEVGVEVKLGYDNLKTFTGTVIDNGKPAYTVLYRPSKKTTPYIYLMIPGVVLQEILKTK